MNASAIARYPGVGRMQIPSGTEERQRAESSFPGTHAALVAELPPRLIRSTAGGAERRQPGATLAAELGVRPVLGATVRADDHVKGLTRQHAH